MVVGDDEYIDWTKKATPVVTPVYNQGRCGCCYSISAVTAIESAVAIKTGNLVQGSIQQPIDCCNNAHNIACSSCNGGFMNGVFYWAVANGGVCTSADYPYVMKQEKCKRCSSRLRIKGHYNLRGLSERYIWKAAYVNPVSIGVNSNTKEFMFYRSGIITRGCRKRHPDHAVVIVGTGIEGDTKYYKVQNSWGIGWGEHGFVRIQAGKNMCSVKSHPSYPVAADDA